jgi:hypothetical protein
MLSLASITSSGTGIGSLQTAKVGAIHSSGTPSGPNNKLAVPRRRGWSRSRRLLTLPSRKNLDFSAGAGPSDYQVLDA